MRTHQEIHIRANVNSNNAYVEDMRAPKNYINIKMKNKQKHKK